MNTRLLKEKINTLKENVSDKDLAIVNKLEKACNNMLQNSIDINKAIIYSNIHVRLNLLLVEYNLI
jgi:hypothetical protein